MVMQRAAARCGEWAQHFSNASCTNILYMYLNGYFLSKYLYLLAGDVLPPVDASRIRLYSMLFCGYAHRTKLVLEQKKLRSDILFLLS